MKNVLVTGVAGFIGSKVAARLCALNYNVFGIDNLSTGYLENIPKNIEFIEGDCAKKETFSSLGKQKFDSILHISGQSSGEISFENPLRDLKDNVESTLNLVEVSKKAECSNFIYASTMSIYGQKPDRRIAETDSADPISFYAVGKLASERYLKIFSSKNFNPIILRLFNVYGPGQNLSNLKQGMISIYLAQAINDRKIDVKGDKHRFRDFIYIDDVVRVFEHFLFQQKYKFEIFNVCTGKKTSVEQILNYLEGILPFEFTTNFLSSTPGDQFGIYGDNAKLIKEIKLDPVEIEEGLKKFCKSVAVE